MTEISLLSPGNLAFLESIYEQYLADPQSVSEQWRRYFAEVETSVPQATGDGAAGATNGGARSEKQVAVLSLLSSIRYRGHRAADLDPLRLYERPAVPDLDASYHGLGPEDMDTVFNAGSLFAEKKQLPLREIVAILNETYCGTIGTELTHITSTQQKRWIQERLERARGRPNYDADKKRDILRWLTAGRKLEEYLHRKYVGQKRFSLEGGETAIPMLDEMVQGAGAGGVKEVVIGMAHRGRLNVLVNIFGKNPTDLFGEFEGKIDVGTGSGDVKYHLGFSSDVSTPGGPCHIVLAFNPSHLEIIDPVVEGSVRARQERRNDHDREKVLPVLIHGDAAFAGQGVVPETLNLSETRGYGTGGTLHLVINNQIGFTTSDPLDSRSTLYCTDVAKLVQAPIFHVNGNDPEAAVFVTALALQFRQQFKKDVVIDLVCYRRHGHNEADEPLVTQPMMYKRIREQKGVRRLYAERLESEGIIKTGDADAMSEAYQKSLERGDAVSRPLVESDDLEYVVDWRPFIGHPWRMDRDTAIPMERVEALGLKFCEYPEDYELHRVVQRIIDARREMAIGKRPIDWGFAEHLAFAALLEDGHPIRLSGQDSQRGTFAHRHAALHNQKKRGAWIPLQHIYKGQPNFRVINSLLSEEAVLGFEYGYSTAEPQTMVIWEAQFGDFANGAQVVIDQFLSSSESKWGRLCGLVMLLPHGYEGQGPEHSSARLERYLQLCAEENIQVAVPTTPAQCFHMFRRQMLRPYRKPLIVMSPKSLLRHRLATSTREEFTTGTFQNVIDEIDPIEPAKVKRLVLCTGKVYYDLLEKRRESQLDAVAIARVEQLYPFPDKEIQALLERYPNAREICWAQEEPRNQGSWFFMLSHRHLNGCKRPDQRLIYAGRDYSASPAVGYLNVHLEQQRQLVEKALGLKVVASRKRKSA